MRPKVLRIRVLLLKDIAIYVPRCGPRGRGPEPQFAVTPPVTAPAPAPEGAAHWITASALFRRRRCRACERTRTPARQSRLSARRPGRDAGAAAALCRRSWRIYLI